MEALSKASGAETAVGEGGQKAHKDGGEELLREAPSHPLYLFMEELEGKRTDG